MTLKSAYNIVLERFKRTDADIQIKLDKKTRQAIRKFKIEFVNMDKGTLAWTDFKTKTIFFDIRHCLDDKLEEVADTIIHEYAHVLAGEKAAHTRNWKQTYGKLKKSVGRISK